jgi:hypothetical protein
MPLPYENATSGAGALEEIAKVLKRFGCGRFGTMTDSDAGELIVQFNARGNEVMVKASIRGYAAAWPKDSKAQGQVWQSDTVIAVEFHTWSKGQSSCPFSQT